MSADATLPIERRFSAMCGELVAVFQQRVGGGTPGGSTLFEKGTARWVRN